MALIHHDTTGTQTDSAKPLSRKNLRSLCGHNTQAFTSRLLYKKTGRLNASIIKELAAAEAEKKRRETEEKEALESKATYKLIEPEKAEETKPNLFKRLWTMFGNLRKRAERESARGK